MSISNNEKLAIFTYQEGNRRKQESNRIKEQTLSTPFIQVKENSSIFSIIKEKFNLFTAWLQKCIHYLFNKKKMTQDESKFQHFEQLPPDQHTAPIKKTALTRTHTIHSHSKTIHHPDFQNRTPKITTTIVHKEKTLPTIDRKVQTLSTEYIDIRSIPEYKIKANTITQEYQTYNDTEMQENLHRALTEAHEDKINSTSVALELYYMNYAISALNDIFTNTHTHDVIPLNLFPLYEMDAKKEIKDKIKALQPNEMFCIPLLIGLDNNPLLRTFKYIYNKFMNYDSINHYTLLLFIKTEEGLQPIFFNSLGSPASEGQVSRYVKNNGIPEFLKELNDNQEFSLPLLDLSQQNQIGLDCGAECINFITFLCRHNVFKTQNRDEMVKNINHLRTAFNGAPNYKHKKERSTQLRNNFSWLYEIGIKLGNLQHRRTSLSR